MKKEDNTGKILGAGALLLLLLAMRKKMQAITAQTQVLRQDLETAIQTVSTYVQPPTPQTTGGVIAQFHAQNSSLFNQILWNEIPDFDIPQIGGRPVKQIGFISGGRNQLNDPQKIWKKGITMLDFKQMIEGVEKTSNYTQAFTSSLATYQRAFIQYINNDANYNTYNFNTVTDAQNYFEGNGNHNLKNTLEGLTVAPATATFKGTFAGGDKPAVEILALDFEPTTHPPAGNQDALNMYLYIQKYLNDNSNDSTSAMLAYNCTPEIMFGNLSDSYYTNAPWWTWNTPAAQTGFSAGKGLPQTFEGKTIEQSTRVVFLQSYPTQEDFLPNGTEIRAFNGTLINASLTHHQNNDRHFLANVLGTVESNARFRGTKKQVLNLALTNLDGSGTSYINANPQLNPNYYINGAIMPQFQAEVLGVFSLFTGVEYIWVWDSTCNTQTLSPAARNNPTQTNRDMSSTQHFFGAVYRVFEKTTATGEKVGAIFTGTETYLNNLTNVKYALNATFEQLNAAQLKARRLPFVRAIVNATTRKLAIAACMPYGDEITNSVTFKFEGIEIPITLTPNELYLSIHSY